MPSIKSPTLIVQPGPGRLPANTVPAAALIFPSVGSSDAALQAHITDPVGAHAATAVSTTNLNAWADGTLNTEIEVQAALAAIIDDLISTSGQRGAGKLTAPAASSWADTPPTTNPEVNLDARVNKIITDLTAVDAIGGAGKITTPAASAWADTPPTLNPATTLGLRVNKIITDLIANEGSDRVRSNVVAGTQLDLAAGDSIFQQITDIVDFINEMLETRYNYWNGGGASFTGGAVEFEADILPKGSITNLGANLLSTSGEALTPRISLSAAPTAISSYTLLNKIDFDVPLANPPIRIYLVADGTYAITKNASVTAGVWNYDVSTQKACLFSVGGTSNAVNMQYSPSGLPSPIFSGIFLRNYNQSVTINGSPYDVLDTLFNNGLIGFAGNFDVLNPPSSYADVRNKLYAKNTPKVWGCVRTEGLIAVEGYNIASVSVTPGLYTQVDFTVPFSDVNYSVSAAITNNSAVAPPSGIYTVHVWDKDVSWVQFRCVNHLSPINGPLPEAAHAIVSMETLSSSERLEFQIFGMQDSV